MIVGVSLAWALPVSSARASETESPLCGDAFAAICQDPAESAHQAELDRMIAGLKRQYLLEAVRETKRVTGLVPRPEFQVDTSEVEAMMMELRQDENWKELIYLEGAVERRVLARLDEAFPGFSAGRLPAIFASLKKELAALVEEEASLAPAIRARMLQDLEGVSIIGAAGLTRKHIAWYDEICDDGGLKRNLYARTDFDRTTGSVAVFRGNEVVVCAGQLLDLLRAPDPERALHHVIGHELGHHIHAVKNWDAFGVVDADGRPIDRNYAPSYAGLLACWERNDRASLRVIEPDAKTRDDYRRIFGREPGPVELHSAEMSGDYWGTRLLARLASRAGDALQAEAVAALNLRRLCDAQTDSGFHPAGRFRIEAALRNPELRGALGCRGPAPSRKPWCGLDAQPGLTGGAASALAAGGLGLSW